jgi:tRNA(Ile)-lysidine synthase
LLQQKKWVVALSGGGDSLCLTMLSNICAINNKIELFACIVDHKLRSESSSEILPIIELLNDNNIRYKVFIWHHNDNIGGNIELKARKARYDFLYNFCTEIGATTLMTAHHAIDQWETFFMRLSRGTSVNGLSCIKPITKIKNIFLARPMLEFTPFDIRETLSERFHINDYVNDPSNNDTKFERTKWRASYKELASKYNLDIANINKSVTRIQKANDCLEKITANIVQEIFNGLYIKMERFMELHNELQIRVLYSIINMISPKGIHIISYSLLEKVSKDMCNPNFNATNLSGIILRRDSTKNIKLIIESRKKIYATTN